MDHSSENPAPTRPRPRPRGPIRVLLLAAIAATAGPGCASDPDAAADRRWAEEGRALFGGTPEGRPDAGGSPAPTGWRVVLSFVSGPDHERRAAVLRDRIAGVLGRSDVRVRSRGAGSVVTLGSYASVDDPAAQRDLERMQGFELDGRRPFAQAYLQPPPPPPADPGSRPEWNLATVRERLGPRAVYSLQVGVYESRDRVRAKRAAEARVDELRRAGETAFYYHGPRRSMVTLGVFDERAFDTRTQSVIPAVRSLQRKHPHNLLNGEPILEDLGGDRPRPQPSVLVLIPE